MRFLLPERLSHQLAVVIDVIIRLVLVTVQNDEEIRSHRERATFFHSPGKPEEKGGSEKI